MLKEEVITDCGMCAETISERKQCVHALKQLCAAFHIGKLGMYRERVETRWFICCSSAK